MAKQLTRAESCTVNQLYKHIVRKGRSLLSTRLYGDLQKIRRFNFYKFISMKEFNLMSDNKKLKGQMNEQLSGSNLGTVAGGGDEFGLNPNIQGTGIGGTIKSEMAFDTDFNFDFKLFSDDIKDDVNTNVTTNITGNNSNAKIDNNPTINIRNK